MEQNKSQSRRQSLLFRRSSVISSDMRFEDRLSIITPDLPPEERLRKLLHMCVRATAHTIKEKSEDEDENFYKLLSYERESPIAPHLTSTLLEYSKKTMAVRNHTASLENEHSEWEKELESRRKKHLRVKQEYKAISSNPTTPLREEELNNSMKKFLDQTSENISIFKSDYLKHSSRLKNYDIHLQKQELEAKRKLDSAENILNHVSKVIRVNTQNHYATKEEVIKSQTEMLKSSLKKIESWL